MKLTFNRNDLLRATRESTTLTASRKRRCRAALKILDSAEAT